ncbi:MAG: hypothetical protein WC412_03940 [Candidatus Omnitrophota bacterium]|jgi:hypothetical protein
MLSAGCSASTELRKIIFGTSLHDFDTAEKKYKKIFEMKPEDCFKRVHDIFAQKHVIFVKSDFKNKLIAAYGFTDYFKPKPDQTEINTTEVGVLFKEVSEGETEVIVISDDFSLAGFIADELFKKLEAK